MISTLGTVPHTQGPPTNLQAGVPGSLRKESRAWAGKVRTAGLGSPEIAPHVCHLWLSDPG